MGGDRLPAGGDRRHPLWGKLGDQYGRKKLFQTAIVIFLVGSALCGMAQNMPQLIGFRASRGSAAAG